MTAIASPRAHARALALACAALLAAACGPDPEALKAEAAARAAEAEAKAEAGAAAFDAAVKQKNWALAKAQADILLHDHPDSQAARRVRAEYEVVAKTLDANRESTRTAALWSYDTQGVAGGLQRAASIYAKDDVDVDGKGPGKVRLIFRDHPSWGRSSYLVLQGGDFDCYRGCRVQVKIDGGATKSLPGSRPDTDEAIAMFIEDDRALWTLAKGAKTLEIEFPVKDLGKRSALFEVGGLDPTRLPGW
jgi:hypothetical protein